MNKLFIRVSLSAFLLASIANGVVAENPGMEERFAQPTVSAVNFNDHETRAAVDFSQLAYDAYHAKDGSDKDAEVTFKTRIDQLMNEGYTVSTFEGETGHIVLPLLSNFFVRKTTIGVFAQKGDDVVIAFRGTDKGSVDWLTNFYILNGYLQKSRFLGEEKGGVHAGYNLVFESYKDQLTKMYLDAVAKGAKNIVIVGHSLGGAMTQLAGLYLAKLAKYKGHEVTIKIGNENAPRVGSPNFVQKLNDEVGVANIVRMTKGHHEAVASAIPGIAGFKHAGTNVVVPTEGWNKLKDHGLSSFKNGEAENAVKTHNANPVKFPGVRDRIRSGLSAFSEGVKNAGQKAKETFVSGFQSFRNGVAGLVGY